jgi:predicted nucleotidyltransferase component of viral defense system
LPGSPGISRCIEFSSGYFDYVRSRQRDKTDAQRFRTQHVAVGVRIALDETRTHQADEIAMKVVTTATPVAKRLMAVRNSRGSIAVGAA